MGGDDLKDFVRRAARAAFGKDCGRGNGKKHARQAVIAICLAGDERVQGLNRDFRGRDRPTNVLSFPGGEEDGPAGQDGQPFHLGDIILSLQTMQREAAELKIPLRHHLAHLVIHGVLHLLGHDHVEDEEAEQMERMERAAMHSLGLPPPPQ